ncbi:sensor histidine kinase [Pseudobutyrivibrio sp. YE44]|uniref:sensor histidine kinase n=1 Tax=Pseudobutyrivibrio sp. YE44 TaxID=1520802 RepID=UPI0015A0507B|nr:GHKL domain-containing protein [Pseudobutyrivibrio sp. YE44]
MLAVSTLIFLINGWQLRNLQLDLKTENWYRLLYFIQAVIIMVVFIAVTKSIQASEKAKHEDENHRNLVEYTCQIENMYEELRSFKHDYTNVLLTLSGYIDNNDMDGLRKYYQDTILPTNEKINQDKYHLHKLSRIQEPAIKGMLSAKLINAMNMGLKIFVDIVDDIPSISMGVIDLTRILGIYIDNAVEAALETESKEIKFNVVLDSNSVVIVVMNSFINKGIAINEMEKHAVSTKGEGRGIGLSNVSEILRRYPNVNKMTEMKNEYFIQTLIVENT